MSGDDLGRIKFSERSYTAEEVDDLLADKQDSLTFDNTPTENSTNPVTSHGIWFWLNELDGSVNSLGEEVASHYEEFQLLKWVVEDIPILPGGGKDSAVQVQNSEQIIGLEVPTNSALSQSAMSEGAGNLSGLRGYRYTNTGAVEDSLTFEKVPEGWEVGDVVSVVNKNKYPDCAVILTISGSTVTFDAPLPFSSIVDESDWDSKVAYVSAKPDKGDVDLGVGAHAEGIASKALNVAAHAEGRETRALGQYSHAEGRGASAKNYIAHAEGHDTVAEGMTSHAEGYSTKAHGDNSHSEGREAETFGANSHAENYNTSASGENSHAEGAQSRTGGTGKPTPITVFTNTGYAAHAEGNGTWATGSSSHAEGYSTVASALAAHAEGNQTVASGMNSHASGLKSVAEGYASTAMGRSAHAQHDRSFVWQGLDTDTQYHSHGIGTFNINPFPKSAYPDPATGFYIGEKTLAQFLAEKANDDNVVHKTGDEDQISGHKTFSTAITLGTREGNVGEYSLAQGISVIASGSYSHAEGLDTAARGNYSHVEGRYANTSISGRFSHAEGDGTASGEASHAEGNGTASGECSHAEGNRTTASGSFSHAEGFKAAATDSYAFAWQGTAGDYTKPEYHSHGQGTFNINPAPAEGSDDPATGFYIGEQTLAARLSAASTAALSELASRVSELDTTSISNFATLKTAFLSLISILTANQS